MAAYKTFRLYLTQNSGGNQGYFAISRWEMYELEDASSPNLLVGGVPTASSSSSGRDVTYAFDGSESTTWESVSSSGVKWIRYDLTEPVEVRSMYLSHNNYSGERPKNFLLQASNDDGETWVTLAVMRDFLTTNVARRTSSVVINLAGKSVLGDGARATVVRVFDWRSGFLIHDITPAADGSWEINLFEATSVMVVHIGPDGYRPLADGPITVKQAW